MVINSLLAFLLLTIVSCSSLKSEQEMLHKAYSSESYDLALTVLNKEEYKKKENKLLFLIESAIVKFKKKNVLEALEDLKEADSLYRKLYTKSIREAILAGILSDNEKSFYGKIYERSSIFHLQLKMMLHLYSGGEFVDKETQELKTLKKINEKREYLKSARAIVLSWNSFYETLKRSDRKNLFAFDVHQKILSSVVHEEFASVYKQRNDYNIALLLLEEVYRNMDKELSVYSSYNSNYKENIEKYLKKKELELTSFTATFKKLKSYVEFKILKISKKIRLNKYRNYSRKIKTKYKNLDKDLVTLIFSKSHLDLMRTKTVSYNLATAFSGIKDPDARKLVTTIGAATLSYFAFGTLGLAHYTSHRNNYVYSVDVNTHLASQVGVEVKVPYFEAKKEVSNLKLIVLNSKEEKVAEKELELLNSYSDRMELSTQVYANQYFKNNLVSIGIKYILAIAAAYTTYEAMKRQENPFASTVAMGQFFLSSKAILASQVVDTRHIIGLSSEDYLSHLLLNSGDYIIQVLNGEEQVSETKVTVQKGQPTLFSLR